MASENKNYIIGVLIALTATTVSALLTIFIELKEFSNKPLIFPIIAIISLLGLLSSIILYKQTRNSIITPYNVALIGFPRSGKTTLITSLFQEIFNRKISKIHATIKGESTIERINEQIERKESGIPIGPTNDQTMFAYRTNLEIGKGFFSRRYKVEFGDYPGEYSEQLSDSEYFSHLKKTEFFKWSVEADAYIFIIDVGKYMLSRDKKNFIATTSKAVRQSWQHFVDYNFASNTKVKNKPVVLVFSKMDLCRFHGVNYSYNEDSILNTAFSETTLPAEHEIDPDKYDLLRDNLKHDFADLIFYLKSECKYFNILFTSSFGLLQSRYAGVRFLLDCILPQKIKRYVQNS